MDGFRASTVTVCELRDRMEGVVAHALLRFPKLQTCFVRQAVTLLRVHGLAPPHEVIPRVPAAARAGHEVVEAAFVRLRHVARVLAAVAVAFANRLRAQLHWATRGGAHGRIRTDTSRVLNAPKPLIDFSIRVPPPKWWVATVLPRALRFKRPLH